MSEVRCEWSSLTGLERMMEMERDGKRESEHEDTRSYKLYVNTELNYTLSAVFISSESEKEGTSILKFGGARPPWFRDMQLPFNSHLTLS